MSAKRKIYQIVIMTGIRMSSIGKENMRAVSIICMALVLASCSAMKVHPGSPNAYDSTIYDALIASHSVIETTKTDLTAGAFPASIIGNVKVAVNDLVAAYNALDTAYQSYHGAALTGTATAAQKQAVDIAYLKVGSTTAALVAAKGIK